MSEPARVWKYRVTREYTGTVDVSDFGPFEDRDDEQDAAETAALEDVDQGWQRDTTVVDVELSPVEPLEGGEGA